MWCTGDKECYPIIHALERFKWITMDHPTPIKVYTDHRNLLYLLKPPSSVKTIVIGRRFRWGMHMQVYRIDAFHVEGLLNTWADICTRWAYFGEGADPEMADKEFDAADLIGFEAMDNGDIKAGNLVFKDAKLVAGLLGFELPPAGKTKAETSALIARPIDTDQDWKAWKQERLSYLHPEYKGDWKLPTRQDTLAAQEKEFKTLTDEEKMMFHLDVKLQLYLNEDNKIWVPRSLWSRILFGNHVKNNHGSVTVEVESLLARYCFLMTKTELIDGLKQLKRLCFNCDGPKKIIR